MKTPALVVLAALAGLTISVRALRASSEAAASQTTYYANGQIESECEVRDGRKEGLCRRFYANGEKQAEGAYAAGRMDGPWTFWREDGSVDAERSGDYVAGDRVGP